MMPGMSRATSRSWGPKASGSACSTSVSSSGQSFAPTSPIWWSSAPAWWCCCLSRACWSIAARGISSPPSSGCTRWCGRCRRGSRPASASWPSTPTTSWPSLAASSTPCWTGRKRTSSRWPAAPTSWSRRWPSAPKASSRRPPSWRSISRC